MTSATTTVHSTRRAWGVVGTFALFGILGVVAARDAGAQVLGASLLTYGALLWQTFFSIRRFTGILNERSAWQRSTDAVFVLVYAGLAASIAEPTRFLFFFVLLFALAVVKYASHHPRANEVALVRRKVVAEGLGAVGCLIALGVATVSPLVGVWLWAIVFLLANATMYRPQKLYA